MNFFFLVFLSHSSRRRKDDTPSGSELPQKLIRHASPPLATPSGATASRSRLAIGSKRSRLRSPVRSRVPTKGRAGLPTRLASAFASRSSSRRRRGSDPSMDHQIIGRAAARENNAVAVHDRVQLRVAYEASTPRDRKRESGIDRDATGARSLRSKPEQMPRSAVLSCGSHPARSWPRTRARRA